MPKRTYANDPTHAPSASARAARAAQNDDVPQAHQSSIVDPMAGTDHHGMLLMATLLDRRDGWLRVVPDGDGKVVWWKWKFTTGPFAGHYAMVRGEQDQHTEAMQVLARKLRAIDHGTSKPTRDSYYDQG